MLSPRILSGHQMQVRLGQMVQVFYSFVGLYISYMTKINKRFYNKNVVIYSQGKLHNFLIWILVNCPT